MAKTKDHKPEKQHEYEIRPDGKNNTGRPTLYDPDYCRDIVLYFEKAPLTKQITETSTNADGETFEKVKNVAARMPCFSDYARKIGTQNQTLLDWCKQHNEFLQAYNECKELQKQWLIEIGLSGFAPPASFIFVAKNITDMKDKSEQDLNVKTYEHYQKEKKEFGK